MSHGFSSPLPLGAGHVQAHLFRRGGLGVQLAHDLALIDHQDTVGQGHDLVQLQAHQQHRLAGVPLGHDLLVDILDGAHVQGPCRSPGR